MKFRSTTFFLFVFSFLMGMFGTFGNNANAQINKGRDSLVRLVDAKAAKLEELNGSPYRIVRGPARFLHNNTYLLCDSAVWNVNDNVIDAIGHVQIIQQDTYLVSDKLTYLSDQNLAQFRGNIVRLYNKKGDQLKTRYLDYFTSDSTAVFYNGGAMRSKDGQIIEGSNGKYEAETRSFSFEGDVEMFADSMFVVAERAIYNSNRDQAFFYDNITAWKERDTVFSNNAVYDNATSCLTLNKDNYVATDNQQIWADSIKYFRNNGFVEMMDNVQLQDDSQQTFLLGDKGTYQPDPMIALLTKNPVAGMWSEDKVRHQIKDSLGVVVRDSISIKRDTLFAKGDTLRMWQLPMYEVDSLEVVRAANRLKLIKQDPMEGIHAENKKYLDAYYKNKELLGKPKDPGIAARDSLVKFEKMRDSLALITAASDSLSSKKLRDSLSNISARDSLNTHKDSLDSSAPVDSTLVTFMTMFRNVKMHRSDVAGACDSLIYTSLDSIARFYKDPILWSEEKNQFTADSIQVALRNNNLYKANLIENAMIVTREDSIHFNQIKSVEMVAYFDENDIYRFDAMGGVQAMLFFAERDTTITLMNQKECKILSAKIVNREIQRVQYVGDIKSDMIPTHNLEIEKQRLRGYTWRQDEMPAGRSAITERSVRASKRGSLKNIRFPIYPQVKIYFPEDHKLIHSLKQSIEEKIAQENREKEERKAAKELEKRQEEEQKAEEQQKQENSEEAKEKFREGVEVLDNRTEK